MAAKINRPGSAASKISYALMGCFTELLICSRCFSHKVRRPVRQVMSNHHQPLSMCHACSRTVLADHKARVLKFN
jgi:hypothetical protein